MGNPRSFTTAFKRVFAFGRKPAALPHVVFSRSKAAARKAVEKETDKTAQLIGECLDEGKYVPEFFVRRSRQEGGVQ